MISKTERIVALMVAITASIVDYFVFDVASYFFASISKHPFLIMQIAFFGCGLISIGVFLLIGIFIFSGIYIIVTGNTNV